MPSKIERLFFGSQASPVASGNLEAGDYELNHDGNGPTAALAYNAADSTVDTAVEGLASIGAGNMTVAATANGYTFTYVGALADTNVAADFTASSVSLKQKADTVSINVTQAGVADVNEVQRVDVGGCTTTFDLNGNSTSATVATMDTTGIQNACDTIWGGGNTVAADLGGGLFSVTFQGTFAAQNIAEMTVTNAGDGSPSVSTTTNGVTGQHHIFTITLSDAPTEGEFRVQHTTSLETTAAIAYDASAATVETAIDAMSSVPFPCAVTGSAGGPWTVESDSNVASASFPFAASDDFGSTAPLRKACAIEIVTTQEGSAGGATNAGFLLLLGVGA